MENGDKKRTNREPDDHGSRGCKHLRKDAVAAECRGNQAPLRAISAFLKKENSLPRFMHFYQKCLAHKN